MAEYETYGRYSDDDNAYAENSVKNTSSADLLRSGEDAASRDATKNGDQNNSSTATSANSRETKSGDFTRQGITSRVQGVKNTKEKTNFLKKKAPIFVIILVLGGAMFGIGAATLMLPFHLVESLTELTDTAFATRSARLPKLVKWAFNMEGDTKYTQDVKNVFGQTTGLKFNRKITSTKMQTRLANEGITVNKADGARGETTLTYLRPDGSELTVTADDYAELYRSDADFRNRMNRGGRSFFGRIAAHIDLTLANFLNSHSLTKNLFANWINKVYDAEGQTATLHSVIEARKPAGMGDLEAETVNKTENPDDSSKVDVEKDSSGVDTKADKATMKANYAKAITQVAKSTTSMVCGAAAVASAITSAKLAVALGNARLGWSSFGETVDKQKAGDGDEAPLNTILDPYLTPDENGYTGMDAEGIKQAVSGGAYTVNTNADDVKYYSPDAIRRDNNFLSDILNFFSKVLNFFGIGSSVSDFASDFGTSKNWIIGCAVANIATAAISMVATIATFILAPEAAVFFSVGKVALGAAVGFATGEAISYITDMLVENATSDFCSDPELIGPKRGACLYLGAENYNGINAQNGGSALATEAKARVAYRNYQLALADEAELIRSEKSPFDVSTSHTFLGSIVSKFSLMAASMPSLASVASSLVSTTSSSLAALLPTASAIDETITFESNIRTDCSNLSFADGLSAVGTADCQEWFTTDQNINNMDVEEAFDFLASCGASAYPLSFGNAPDNCHYGDQFEKNADGTLKLENGNEAIKKDSELAKFISYCSYRTSPFGQIDQNILSQESALINPDGFAGKIVSSIANAIDGLDDFINIAESGEKIKALGWATGANCIARDAEHDTEMTITVNLDGNGNVTSGGTPYNIPLVSWEHFMKYAQSYVSDRRLLETSGDETYTSPVQEYAVRDGLTASDGDLSLVDYLAKYTGYAPENMQIALNEYAYWTLVAEYDPEGKGPYLTSPETAFIKNRDYVDLVQSIDKSSDVLLASSPLPEPEILAEPLRHVLYAPLRSRDVAMA